MEHVEVEGLRIAFERRGRGEPLVLLHGLPGNAGLWRRQLDDLSDEFTVVAWDAPGCGRSSDPEEPFGLTDIARYLAGFMDSLGLGPPHLLGLSWGTGVALELYRTAPEVPVSLVLAGGYARWAGSLPPGAVEQRLAAYLTASRTPPDEALRDWGPGFFSPGAPPELAAEAASMCSDFHPQALATLARSFAKTDLRAVLPTVAYHDERAGGGRWYRIVAVAHPRPHEEETPS